MSYHEKPRSNIEIIDFLKHEEDISDQANHKPNIYEFRNDMPPFWIFAIDIKDNEDDRQWFKQLQACNFEQLPNNLTDHNDDKKEI